MRFLLSQSKPWPLVVASLVPALFLQPSLLEYFLPLMGVKGSAASIAITQWVTLLMGVVIIWIKPVHKQETWPGLSWQLLLLDKRHDLMYPSSNTVYRCLR